MLNYELKYAELSNGETLAYREAGNGENVILLIHGNMSSGFHYAPILESLPENYKAYAVDLRGFGESTYNNKINSLKDFADDIYDFAAKLELKSFDMVGWSAGGGICLQFAADYPDYARKLVLIESASFLGFPLFKKSQQGQLLIGEVYSSREEMALDPLQVAPALNAINTKNFEYMDMLWDMVIYTNKKPSEEDNNIYISESLKQKNLIDMDWALANFNMSNKHNGYVQGSGLIDNVDLPVLSIWGKKDLVVSENMVRETVEAIGENAKLVVLEDAGHSPLVDCPDKLMDIIIDFIRQV